MMLEKRYFFCNKMVRVNRLSGEAPGVIGSLVASRVSHWQPLVMPKTSHTVYKSVGDPD